MVGSDGYIACPCKGGEGGVLGRERGVDSCGREVGDAGC